MINDQEQEVRLFFYTRKYPEHNTPYWPNILYKYAINGFYTKVIWDILWTHYFLVEYSSVKRSRTLFNGFF